MFWLSNDHTGGPATRAAAGRRQRPRGRQDRRRDLAQQVLEGLRDLRGRGRQPGRRRPRRRPPRPDPGHQPLGRSTAWSTATYYSQITMVRTIEQILGAQPLNQKDAAATPMFDAFTVQAGLHAVHRGAEPDLADRDIATPPACGLGHPGRGRAARGRRRRPCRGQQTSPTRRRGRPGPASSTSPAGSAQADFANPEQMNRFTWYQAHDWRRRTRVTRRSTSPTRCRAPTSRPRRPTDTGRAAVAEQ